VKKTITRIAVVMKRKRRRKRRKIMMNRRRTKEWTLKLLILKFS
jgi:hypothetical protein